VPVPPGSGWGAPTLPSPRPQRQTGYSSTTELAYSTQRSIRRSQKRTRCGAVRKCTVARLSPTRPSSGVYRELVSRAGGRSNEARQAGEGVALSSTS
jgi:hypothetical protein